MLVSKKQEWYVEEEEQTAPSFTTVKCKLNRSLRAKCLLIVIMFSMMAVVTTARSEAIVRSGYELVGIKAQLTNAEKENEQLRLEIARLKSPQRIQQIATRDLGMIIPKNIYCSAAVENTTINQAPISSPSIAQAILNLLNFHKVEASKGR